MKLILDIGNTRVKAAVFENDTLLEVFVFEKTTLLVTLQKIKKAYLIDAGILASVADVSSEMLGEVLRFFPFLVLSSKTKVPFVNSYATPDTLGVDRLALIAAAVAKYPQKNVLVIDAGSCVTFDVVTKDSEYLGGAISPGLQMRYKALHQFTGKLPLLSVSDPEKIVGTTTEESMHTGVVRGLSHEIEGTIQEYQSKYSELTIVLTGGDANFLGNQLKSVIFAHPNFVLEGLHTILTYNLNK